MTDIFRLADSHGALKSNVIFLHGLGGHPYRTWQATSNQTSLWPRWLSEDVDGLATWSIGYDAPISRWRGHAMHLVDRAENILGRLLTNTEFQEGRIILIGHSFGGLIIKQLLRTLEMEAKRQRVSANMLTRIDKVAFLATPHTGADLTVWSDRLRILAKPSAATMSLLRNDPQLRDLNRWYRDWSHDQKIFHLVLRETRPTRIFGMVVKPDSADPGLHQVRVWPTDTDHFSISKPPRRESEVYAYVKDFILNLSERPTPELTTIIEVQKEIKDNTKTIITLLDQVQRVPPMLVEQLPEIIRAATAPLEQINDNQKKVIIQLEQNLNANRAQVLDFFRILGEAGVRPEAIPTRLVEIADHYKTLLRQSMMFEPGDAPEMVGLKENIQDSLARSDLKGADMYLAVIQASQDRDVEARSLLAAATRGQRGEIARTQLRYHEAAAHFADAASCVPASAETERIGYLDQQAVTLFAQGTQFGDNAALIQAIEVIRSLADLLPHDRAASEWAKTQHNLGVVFWQLAEHDQGTAYLEKAIAAFHAALEVRTRELMPLEWAQTQNGIGIVLWRLGERSETTFLEKAIAAFHAALEVRTPEMVPLEWAETQNNLGTALQTLGGRESRSLRLEEAVAAYKAALTEYSRDRMPIEWAQTQNNLGAAIMRLSERQHLMGQEEMAVAAWDKAAAAYDAALQVRTRERLPLGWAQTQNNLGNFLLTIGERRKETASLNKAAEFFRAALLEFTREHIPLEWAQTQMNLAVALVRLGELEGRTIRFKKAIAAVNAALEVRTREQVPALWAETQINLAHMLATLGEREIGTMRLEKAITAYDAALLVLKPTHAGAANCRINRDRTFALYMLRKSGFGYSTNFVIGADSK